MLAALLVLRVFITFNKHCNLT